MEEVMTMPIAKRVDAVGGVLGWGAGVGCWRWRWQRSGRRELWAMGCGNNISSWFQRLLAPVRILCGFTRI